MASGQLFLPERARLQDDVGLATREDIAAHLMRCDANFVPPLFGRLDIAAYAGKIRDKAVTFEAWDGPRLVGLVAAYLNDPAGADGFVTSVSVEPAFQECGIAVTLMHNCLREARVRGFRRVTLEVECGNERALALYRRVGFQAVGPGGDFLKMAWTTEG